MWTPIVFRAHSFENGAMWMDSVFINTMDRHENGALWRSPKAIFKDGNLMPHQHWHILASHIQTRLNLRQSKCRAGWNKLAPELRLAPSVAVFEKKLLSKIRPPAKSVFGINDPKGLSHLTQLRVGHSKLNFHKLKHNFRDTINPMCPTSDGIEDTKHFFCSAPLLMLNVEIFSLKLSN